MSGSKDVNMRSEQSVFGPEEIHLKDSKWRYLFYGFLFKGEAEFTQTTSATEGCVLYRAEIRIIPGPLLGQFLRQKQKLKMDTETNAQSGAKLSSNAGAKCEAGTRANTEAAEQPNVEAAEIDKEGTSKKEKVCEREKEKIREKEQQIHIVYSSRWELSEGGLSPIEISDQSDQRCQKTKVAIRDGQIILTKLIADEAAADGADDVADSGADEEPDENRAIRGEQQQKAVKMATGPSEPVMYSAKGYQFGGSVGTAKTLDPASAYFFFRKLENQKQEDQRQTHTLTLLDSRKTRKIETTIVSNGSLRQFFLVDDVRVPVLVYQLEDGRTSSEERVFRLAEINLAPLVLHKLPWAMKKIINAIGAKEALRIRFTLAK